MIIPCLKWESNLVTKKKDKKQIQQRKAAKHAKRARRKQRGETPPQFVVARGQSGFPDRRIMERSLADIGRLLEEQGFDSIDQANAYLQEITAHGPVPSSSPRTPLEQAQNLMYDAWEASSPQERLRLAQQALKISPDCADAYVLLAEETALNSCEAGKLYQRGVEAGERALGEACFNENAGRFWGILETRPYMRARAGLAQTLWVLGKHEAAVEHFRELLRLNPSDNQGNRYELLAHLLDLERYDEAEELLAQYEDDWMADWLYSRALVAFYRNGDSAEARRRLKDALQENRHVPHYLLGRKRLPQSLPGYLTWGGEDEAATYAARFFSGWQKIPGALDWLAEQTT